MQSSFRYGEAQNPLRFSDAHGMPVKSSPGRTDEEQHAIESFIRSHGVRRIDRNVSGLEPDTHIDWQKSARESAQKKQGAAEAAAADQRVRKMLFYILENGPKKAPELAVIGGYSRGKTVHDVLRKDRFVPLVELSDGKYRLTDGGVRWLKK